MRRLRPTPSPSIAPSPIRRRLQVGARPQKPRGVARIDDEIHREDEEAGRPDEDLPWPQ